MTTTTAPQTAPLAQLIDLTDRIAIVTGGAMGIGPGIARRLPEARASVVIADLDDDAATGAAQTLKRARADSALSLATDVSAPDSVARMLDATRERFGGVDILVNNAGIYPMVPLRELDVETFRRVLDVCHPDLPPNSSRDCIAWPRPAQPGVRSKPVSHSTSASPRTCQSRFERRLAVTDPRNAAGNY